MKVYAIVSGNHYEARRWADAKRIRFCYGAPYAPTRKNKAIAFFVHNAEQLRGMRGIEIVRVGSYLYRKDIEEIERQAKILYLTGAP